MRKLSGAFLLILSLSLFAAHPARAAKSYYAEYFNVQIDLGKAGSAIITETVKFGFEGDPFSFAFRQISARNTDGLTFIDASLDGQPMPRGSQAGQVEVQDGDPLKVTWHFPPTSNAAHVFVVRYRADGVVRKDQGDTLIWRAIPEDHEYSIDRATITVTYPPAATVQGQPSLDWNYDAAWEADRVVLTASGITADEDLVLTARFAEGSLIDSAPRWQIQNEQAEAARSRALPAGMIAGLATLLLGGLGLFTYIRSQGRDLNVNPIVATANPPSDAPPALVGKLTGQQHTFMGAIFDLAQRGLLEVREEKGFLGIKTHMLIRKSQDPALQPHEEELLAALFKPGETRLPMGEVGSRLAVKNDLFAEPLEQELVQRGWLDPERKQKRTRLGVGGAVLLIVSLLVFMFSAVTVSASLPANPSWLPWTAAIAGVSAGLFFLSTAFLIYAATYSTLTPVGEEQAARWKGFAEYLKQVSKGREPAIRPDYFERYLAYAAAFGLGAGWAKYFQKLGGVPLPIWFHATAGSDGDFGAIVAVMAASDTAGASTGGDGVGGASGGGSSGAG